MRTPVTLIKQKMSKNNFMKTSKQQQTPTLSICETENPRVNRHLIFSNLISYWTVLQQYPDHIPYSTKQHMFNLGKCCINSTHYCNCTPTVQSLYSQIKTQTHEKTLLIVLAVCKKWWHKYQCDSRNIRSVATNNATIATENKGCTVRK